MSRVRSEAALRWVKSEEALISVDSHNRSNHFGAL
jgi:hypothetical protein